MTRVTDRVADAALLLLAGWTLVYHLGLLFRPPTWTLLAVWLALAAVCAALLTRGVLKDRPLWNGSPSAIPRPAGRGVQGRGARPLTAVAAAVAVVTGIVAGTSAGLHGSGVPWWCTWAPGLVSVCASAFALLRVRTPAEPGRASKPSMTGEASEASPSDAEAGEPGERTGGRWGTPVALATGAGFAAASLFIVNSDGDDAYFVSRSVATADSGRIPFRDVIFTQGATGPVAGEPPVSSIEVLAGAIARVLGVPAPSFLWYVLLPVVTFLAVWSLWRLARSWAPRRAAACFAVAALYLLWSGTGPASLGSFHLLRMWQGKAVLVSALIPVLYVYLTRFAQRPTRSGLLLLAAAGVAAIGLTSTAAIIIPLVTVAAAAPLVASGRVRTGLAACAAMAYPLGAGLAVALFHGNTSVVGHVAGAPRSFSWVLLDGVLGVLAGCALWAAPWCARRAVPSLIALGGAAVVTLALLPGVMGAVGDAAGTAQVMWRTLWVAPAPVLIGLLATVSPPAGLRERLGAAASRAGVPLVLAPLAPFVPAAALAVAIVAAGTPVWSEANGSWTTGRPAWKFPAVEVGTARAVIGAAGPDGTVLMPKNYMRAVPLLSTRVHAVNANDHYLEMVPAPPPFAADRLLLTEVVRAAGGDKPSAAEVREALRRVGVTAACAAPRDKAGLVRLEEAGYGGRRRIGSLLCVFPAKN
ncbi:DUF6077 domain-containing protein [Actinomadura xylanilytica]|uniref:DUF6077 domain-containing protein n=1 Tax=Actinomadura xylanilytica TaxID=887459 RepID=UPI00255AF6AF|nr:DUF6077 domain-containing protein [Actinomadura xylanilytica]MDL4776401.1 DUF6077 domain-containing protein [Actinomadura xylanilytica]